MQINFAFESIWNKSSYAFLQLIQAHFVASI
jgi:hypothetical protein